MRGRTARSDQAEISGARAAGDRDPQLSEETIDGLRGDQAKAVVGDQDVREGEARDADGVEIAGHSGVERAAGRDQQHPRAGDARQLVGGLDPIGESCSRRLQYEYLKAPKDADAEFCGQSLRIFALGHVLEDLAIEWLRKAGFDLRVRNRHGEQFGFSAAGGRVQGHADGVVVTAPNGMAVPALWECKSANAKNWRDIVKRGVRVAKPIYAAQIALYQAYLGLTAAPALFTAINKDTCELRHELVRFVDMDPERLAGCSLGV